MGLNCHLFAFQDHHILVRCATFCWKSRKHASQWYIIYAGTEFGQLPSKGSHLFEAPLLLSVLSVCVLKS